ncbi:mycofactocin system FadH/OYE family oxidoreductase 2 [Amycolatopsis granulosa]|uniref:mycofactocin system FadH/OYE family oxidoreductase 2 n=1 Tax=Amycolatopsis granulosa TaxID=185684 RepID=UPI001421DE3E|nr:2,4-dienoyl-CoA reductase (NADPH2) [Amycolatopsis granulosa]
MSLLFEPLRLGPVEVRNRIVFAAHLTNYAAGNLPTEQHAAYYAARAAGGAGLIISEEHVVHPSDWPYEKVIHGYRPEVVPGYRRITGAVHAHGVPIFAQLNHNGGQAWSRYSRRVVWAPSPVPDPLFREVPKAMSRAEIAEVVAGYGRVARHCAEGGFDGVEIQCSQSSLVRGFLAPATNLRTDDYGGPLVNRARILREIIGTVRAAIGPSRALGVRLSGDDLVEGGVTLGEAVEVARMIAPGVDYLNTSIGVATATLYLVEPSMAVPRGYALPVAGAFRRAVSLPVVGIGRIKDPAEAEHALAEGLCDLVGVVRGQIADPAFAARARAGQAVRTCLSCNQECAGRVGLNRWLGCVANPRAGREAVPLPAPGPRPKRVLVVGGGPAGLRAAATAAQRGHQVTLYERAASAGGQIALAATAPGRAELGDLVRDLTRECRAEGADLRTGVAVTASRLLAEAPDAVVLATGARPVVPEWAAGLPRVVHARDVLGGVSPSGSVVVIDETGFHPATSVAELLARRGCRVTLSTPGMVVGQDLGITLDRELFARRAHALGVTESTDEMVLGAAAAEDGGVVLRVLRHTTGEVRQVHRDWVVCATHQAPEDSLWHALRDAPFPVLRAGDCLAPRRAHAAVVEGHRAGVSL